MRIVTPSLFAVVLTAWSAQAQPLQTLEKVVVAGRTQQIERIVGLDPDCRPNGSPTVSLLQEPRQGHVTVEKVQAFPNYPSLNPRSKCNTRKVPAQGIFFSAPKNATGEDAFIIEIIDNLGSPRRVRFHVTIRSSDGVDRMPPEGRSTYRNL